MNKTGFGFLRLPRMDANDEKSTDYALLNALVDRFIALGGTYFDTAYTYLGGESERAIRKAVVERYPRDAFVLADKLPGYKVKEPSDCRCMFDEQLERCGVEYFDVYLLHWLNEANYEACEKYDEFGFLRSLKVEGKVKKIGFSYHDSPELLDKILNAHPEVDIVQLQINYLDWDSVTLQAKHCYDIAAKHGKRIVIMEPVKGGSLASLPDAAARLLKALQPGTSAAAWAMSFCTELDHVDTVLSGMNALEQVEDNMRDFAPLTPAERAALTQAADILRCEITVPCTGCGYCAPHCPKRIPIPGCFALYNDYARNPRDGWKMDHAYKSAVAGAGSASDCIKCGACARNCPQGINIPEHIGSVAAAFEA